MAKIGRPKAENPKDCRVMVRLTAEQYATIKRAAAESDCEISSWIRAVIVGRAKRALK